MKDVGGVKEEPVWNQHSIPAQRQVQGGARWPGKGYTASTDRSEKKSLPLTF
jgi:hypothetical protein